MNKPRQFTVEEVRGKFLRHVWGTIRYWDSLPDKTPRQKLEGLAFSILASLDGSADELPAFLVAPSPHPDDEAYHRDLGENWYPRVESEHDISGCLHELFHKFGERS